MIDTATVVSGDGMKGGADRWAGQVAGLQVAGGRHTEDAGSETWLHPGEEMTNASEL